MKLYLSAYQLGNKKAVLKKLLRHNKTIGYIPNALDYSTKSKRDRHRHIKGNIAVLTALGLEVHLIDLRKYFGKSKTLQRKLKTLGGVWVSGGNVFVLRQAMKLSGFDKIIQELSQNDNYVYGGSSAGGCVLSMRLDAYKIVDDATETPYPSKKVTWGGLGFLPYTFLPHYNSDHHESAGVEKEVKYCIKHKILFKALRDGEVIITST